MYRFREGGLEVLLVHPGGPFFAKKDGGAWSIPKGLIGDGEDALEAAKREFIEETGFPVGSEEFVELGEVRLASGKEVGAWAFPGDCDPADLSSNTFELEWPPKSGRRQSFPEIDRAAWFSLEEARHKVNPAQRPLLERLLERLER